MRKLYDAAATKANYPRFSLNLRDFFGAMHLHYWSKIKTKVYFSRFSVSVICRFKFRILQNPLGSLDKNIIRDQVH